MRTQNSFLPTEVKVQLRRFALILASCSLSLAVFAVDKMHNTHIYYDYLGNDSVQVHLEMITECACNSSSTPTTTDFKLTCKATAFTQQVQANLTASSIVNANCPQANLNLDSCAQGSCNYTAFRRDHYSTIVDFSTLAQSSCTLWDIVWTVNDRPIGSNYGSQQPMTTYTTIDWTSQKANQSGRLLADRGVSVYCEGDYALFDWGYYNPDGDRLEWRLDTALVHWGPSPGYVPLTYQSGLTALNPINGIVIDSTSGRLKFPALTIGNEDTSVFAVAVVVDEYDQTTGVLKSSTHLEHTIIVTSDCGNRAPVLDSFSFFYPPFDQSTNTLEACRKQSLLVEFLVYDYDSSGALSQDSIHYVCSLDSFIQGGVTIESSGTNPDTLSLYIANFDPSVDNFNFSIYAMDDHCSNIGVSGYPIAVRTFRPIDLGNDTAICATDSLTLDAQYGDTFYWTTISGDPIQVGTNIGCNTCQQTWVHPSQTTTYVVQSNSSSFCGNTDTITVSVINNAEVDIMPQNGGTGGLYAYCANDPTDSIINSFSGGVYSGNGITDSINGIFDPSSIDPGIGQQTSSVITYDLNAACGGIDSVEVVVNGLPDAHILSTGPFDINANAFQLQATSTALTGSWWSPDTANNPDSTGWFDPSHFSEDDTILVYYQLSDSFGCSNQDSVHFTFIDTVVGIATINSDNELLVFPNPAHSFITLSFGLDGQLISNVKLYDTKGALVLEEQPNEHTAHIDVRGLRNGNYNLVVDGAQGRRNATVLIIDSRP